MCASLSSLIVSIGNKTDLEQERQVLFEEACDLAKDKEILAALETSAKVMRVLSHVNHEGVGYNLKFSLSSSSSPLCQGESECGRSLHLDGSRAAVS